jgi:hypothetical protein
MGGYKKNLLLLQLSGIQKETYYVNQLKKHEGEGVRGFLRAVPRHLYKKRHISQSSPRLPVNSSLVEQQHTTLDLL